MSALRAVLVNYHCIDDIERQLRSGLLDGADVVLVDNDSDPDRVCELAQSHEARPLLMPDNVGFAAAVNAAVALPDRDDGAFDSVLLLNPDVDLDRGQLRRLQAELDATGADAVGPVLVDETGRTWVSSAGGPVTLSSVVWYFAGVSHVLPWLSGFFWTRRQIRSRRPASPHWLCGACLLVRRSAFERYGDLPTDEIVYGEDVGWGVDVVAAGGRLFLARDVVVVHAGGGSGGSHVWADATGRTFRRRLGPLRGRLAVAVMRVGLTMRRLLRSWLR
jgi:GT2 family glycosyltransferase